MAIKTVKKEFIDQDPKVKENLEREINIMKALSTCQYAVRLHNVMVRRLVKHYPSHYLLN